VTSEDAKQGRLRLQCLGPLSIHVGDLSYRRLEGADGDAARYELLADVLVSADAEKAGWGRGDMIGFEIVQVPSPKPDAQHG
jgi:hypothetical protein